MKKQLRQGLLLTYDIIAILLSIFLSFYLRFDANLLKSPDMAKYLQEISPLIFTIVLIKIIILYILRMYSSLWKYASVEEAMQIVISSALATSAFMGYMLIMRADLPRSIYIITFALDTFLFAIARLSYRTLRVFKERKNYGVAEVKNVIIVGAGQAGAAVIKELKNHSELKSRAVALIDDDESKIGQTLNGVPVVGSRYSIREFTKRYNAQQIIIAIPSTDKLTIKEIVAEASQTDAELKIVPGIYELIDGKIDVTKLRNVEITDLLGRKEVELDNDVMQKYVDNKTIMVTGGAGSIGSELCRQIAKYSPKELIILDNYENNTYLLELELRKKYPELKISAIIANIRERERIFNIIKKYKPAIIFHAAAHKHVPLMETAPSEAIKNNVFGTKNIMDAAEKYKVNKFVMISTDKAVNPTNVMGASKRIAEMLIQSRPEDSHTKYVAVRFGNVLGSNGSVIPIFKRQIAEGGPVTVTHPKIERYFMTIPEACKLVIQASTFAKNNEIFVLDMGEPVKIITLAENLIRLSGLKPYEDIEIIFSGLRPGEKMYEELILNQDKSIKTENEKIFIEKPDDFSVKYIDELLAELKTACNENSASVKAVLKKHIPTYEPKENK